MSGGGESKPETKISKSLKSHESSSESHESSESHHESSESHHASESHESSESHHESSESHHPSESDEAELENDAEFAVKIKNLAKIKKLDIGFFHFLEGFLTGYQHRSSGLFEELVIDGKTGVKLWKSLPREVGLAAANKWFELSKAERATYIDEGCKLFKEKMYIKNEKKKMKDARDYATSVFCEDFIGEHTLKYPDDPVNDLAGKAGRELLSALSGHVQLSKLFEEAMESLFQQVRDCQYSLVSPRLASRSRKAWEGTANYVKRAKILWHEDLMKAYKKKLEEAAKAEQEVEEAAKDLKIAFLSFCEEYYSKEEVLTEDIKDAAHDQWSLMSSSYGRSQNLPERDPYVDGAKKRRIEYHEKAMMKSKLAGASGLSTSIEDLKMDAYIENWEKAAKARESKMDLKMEAYKEKLDNGVVEYDYDDFDKTVFVESGMIHLPDTWIVTSDGILHCPPCGYTYFTKKFSNENREEFAEYPYRASRLADEKWDKLTDDERAEYLAMAQKDIDAYAKRLA